MPFLLLPFLLLRSLLLPFLLLLRLRGCTKAAATIESWLGLALPDNRRLNIQRSGFRGCTIAVALPAETALRICALALNTVTLAAVHRIGCAKALPRRAVVAGLSIGILLRCGRAGRSGAKSG